MSNDLDRLHDSINSCRICESYVQRFTKPLPLNRGRESRVMIIGREPGTSELTSGKAFSGSAGKRLAEWLRRCGAPDDYREHVYLTSVIKCPSATVSDFAVMRRNCASFLVRQLAIVRPTVVVSLGKEAFDAMNIGVAYSHALCSVFNTRQYVILTPSGHHFDVLAWPHPSGLNRWLNNAANIKRLERSFDEARRFFQS